MRDDFEIKELESFFGKKVKSSGPKKEAQATKQAKQACIDPNRSRNIEIMLSSIKIPYPEVAASLLSYNKDASLKVEQLEKMRPYIPEPEELARIRTACGGEGKLGKAEKYFLAMSRVERFGECIRFNPSYFKRHFPSLL